MNEVQYNNLALSTKIPIGRIGFGYMEAKVDDIPVTARDLAVNSGYPTIQSLFDYKNSLYKITYQTRLYQEQGLEVKTRKVARKAMEKALKEKEKLRKLNAEVEYSKAKKIKAQDAVKQSYAYLENSHVLLQSLQTPEEKAAMERNLRVEPIDCPPPLCMEPTLDPVVCRREF